MKSIADNFEVFGISLVQSDGTAATPGGNITLYLQADMTYDRNEIVVYHMAEDGALNELSADGYGRYVKFDSDKTGTFIVCIPGVAFIMPIWGVCGHSCCLRPCSGCGDHRYGRSRRKRKKAKKTQ